MSGLPAKKFGITNRGVLTKGNHADLVIFDPEKIKDLATIENPYQYSQGIDYVFVNGQIALNSGKITDQRAGEVLRRKASLFEF